MRTAVFILLLHMIAGIPAIAQRFVPVQVFPNLLLVEPIGLVCPRDGSNRLYVVEQPGVVKVFENRPDVSDYGVFLDLRDRVASGGEMGLLGLAFDPDFKNNGFVYVDYTTPDPVRTIVSRFHVDAGNSLAVDSTGELVLLSIDQPDRIHKGGQLAFGADGYLYISTGDGGGAGDPWGNGQNLSTLLGKILRIDVTGANTEQPYTVPPDNPFVDSAGARPEIYAYGLRNPWRFAFDRPTGRLWCGDVGQDMWEEVDTIERGRNYGWPRMEGFACYKPPADCDTAGLTLPLWTYRHEDADGGFAITGGAVYRGPSLPSLAGTYIYADFVSGRIWSLEYDDRLVPVNTPLVDTDLGISSFGVDASDELYFCSYGGAIYKLAVEAGVDDDADGAGFDLGAIAPNPASGATAIAYTLDRPAHVSLTVHDAMGREVARPVDAARGAGRHTATLDAGTLPAGAYYCRLNVGGRVGVRRMIVIR